MRQIIVTLLSIGLADIALGHTLDSKHGVVETFWHQIAGLHHLPVTLGLIVGSVVFLAIMRRRIVGHRTR